MFGAILGDIIGSAREWKRIKVENFELFPPQAKFTDDTVMTMATADAILNNKDFGACYHEWGNRYPNAGYGGKFRKWLKEKDPKPYGSFGNGSAMRVAPAGWVCDTLEETISLAEKTALPTHNHIEGIKGAKAVAGAIFLARTGHSKNEIAEFITKDIGYKLDRSLDDIRPEYQFDSTCQGSVPEAIICFLEGDSFEDVVRKAVSLGGDADTQACIAGSIAEAFYEIPQHFIVKLNNYLPRKDMMKILLEFQKKYQKSNAKAIE